MLRKRENFESITFTQNKSKCPAGDKIDPDTLSIYDKIMYGGIGFGTVCVPTYIGQLILTILFPPLGVLLDEKKKGFPKPTRIITCLILTSLFYFPGLIYGLNGLSCGG